MKRLIEISLGFAAATVFGLVVTGSAELAIIAGAAFLLLLGVLSIVARLAFPKVRPVTILLIALIGTFAIPASVYLWPREIGEVTIRQAGLP